MAPSVKLSWATDVVDLSSKISLIFCYFNIFVLLKGLAEWLLGHFHVVHPTKQLESYGDGTWF